MALLCLASHFAGIARIHVRKHHALAGQFLYRIGQLLDLCAIPLIGWYHIPCQQLTQSISPDALSNPCGASRRRSRRARRIPVLITKCGCPGS
ncbi:hypothetical protein X962_5889 [Burkholderia pseudomallei MSHR7343]|nr:hypothetical protein X948_5681 [Burkholderia pseudomallei MSHR5608]KGS19425.1 hypothetical protein X962_5889 [Burkholderia pseudomallei MSHR7343]